MGTSNNPKPKDQPKIEGATDNLHTSSVSLNADKLREQLIVITKGPLYDSKKHNGSVEIKQLTNYARRLLADDTPDLAELEKLSELCADVVETIGAGSRTKVQRLTKQLEAIAIRLDNRMEKDAPTGTDHSGVKVDPRFKDLNKSFECLEMADCCLGDLGKSATSLSIYFPKNARTTIENYEFRGISRFSQFGANWGWIKSYRSDPSPEPEFSFKLKDLLKDSNLGIELSERVKFFSDGKRVSQKVFETKVREILIAKLNAAFEAKVATKGVKKLSGNEIDSSRTLSISHITLQNFAEVEFALKALCAGDLTALKAHQKGFGRSLAAQLTIDCFKGIGPEDTVIINGIIQELKENSHYSKNFDYEGSGSSFFKTDIKISQNQDGTFKLEVTPTTYSPMLKTLNLPELVSVGKVCASKASVETNIKRPLDLFGAQAFVLDLSNLGLESPPKFELADYSILEIDLESTIVKIRPKSASRFLPDAFYDQSTKRLFMIHSIKNDQFEISISVKDGKELEISQAQKTLEEFLGKISFITA